MKNILKQLEEWAIPSKSSEFERATLKLTTFYVFSTFVILLVSSLAVVILFSPPESTATKPALEEVHIEIEDEEDSLNIYEFREHLPIVLLVVDIAVLILVSILSYYFAKRTLSPIKQSQEKQAQFMSDAAHELRTPLSVMRTGAETMLRREHNSEEYKDFVSDVKVEAVRLSKLTNQLLQLLKLGVTPKIEKVEFNASQFTLKEVKRFAAYAEERQISLKTEVTEGIKLYAEPDSFIQLLQNLLKNAIDYNWPQGQVAVSLKELAEGVKLEVVDSGIGIPTDKQQAIFSRFTKLDKSRRQLDDTGAGLGLAIVKEIVDRHHGQIELQSTVGEGTKISVIWPKSHS